MTHHLLHLTGAMNREITMADTLTVKKFISLLQECDLDKVLSIYNIDTGARHYLDISDIDFNIEGHVEINISE